MPTKQFTRRQSRITYFTPEEVSIMDTINTIIRLSGIIVILTVAVVILLA